MRRVSTKRSVSICGAALALAVCGGLSAQDNQPGQESKTESHPVVAGDTMWGLSGKYLGSSYEWPRLWSYNPEITNPHFIYPGHVLRLREGAAGGLTAEQVTAAQKTGLLRKGGKVTSPGKLRMGEQTYLDAKALKEAARIVGAPEDHMMFSTTDEVYLQLAKDGGELAEGKEVVVFQRIHRAELNPNSGTTIRIYKAGDGGEVVRVIGALRVKNVDPDKRIARAMVLSATDPIERGFEVADVPPTLTEVAPKPSNKKVEARILASDRPLGTLGQGQVVFISAGAKQGVEVGNRFVVIRQGDPWRQNLYLREELSGQERPTANPLPDSAYPWEVVGEIRAVHVRDDSTTGFITDALTELTPGDRVELREGY